MDFPHGVYVTLRKVTTTEDSLGDATTADTTRRWGPCAVWDRFANETGNTNAPAIVVGLNVAGPRVAIDNDDILTINGLEYRVDGLPQTNTKSPFTGWDPGIVVPVKRAATVS